VAHEPDFCGPLTRTLAVWAAIRPTLAETVTQNYFRAIDQER
jgi:hypothetical protein